MAIQIIIYLPFCAFRDLLSKSLSKIDDLLETVPADIMKDVTGESASLES